MKKIKEFLETYAEICKTELEETALESPENYFTTGKLVAIQTILKKIP